MYSDSKRRMRAGARLGGLKAARTKRRRKRIALREEAATATPERQAEIAAEIARLNALDA